MGRVPLFPMLVTRDCGSNMTKVSYDTMSLGRPHIGPLTIHKLNSCLLTLSAAPPISPPPPPSSVFRKSGPRSSAVNPAPLRQCKTIVRYIPKETTSSFDVDSPSRPCSAGSARAWRPPPRLPARQPDLPASTPDSRGKEREAAARARIPARGPRGAARPNTRLPRGSRGERSPPHGILTNAPPLPSPLQVTRGHPCRRPPSALAP